MMSPSTTGARSNTLSLEDTSEKLFTTACRHSKPIICFGIIGCVGGVE